MEREVLSTPEGSLHKAKCLVKQLCLIATDKAVVMLP